MDNSDDYSDTSKTESPVVYFDDMHYNRRPQNAYGKNSS